MKKVSQKTNHFYLALVEDNDDIREILEINLKKENYQVDSFFSAEQFLRAFVPKKYNLIILDIMLPGKNGIILAREILDKEKGLPILFISALSQNHKITEAYELGAVDYIVKPFNIELFLLKIRNLLKYFSNNEAQQLPQILGNCQILWEQAKVKKNEEVIFLSPKEADMLRFFIENPGRILSREEILEKIWGKKDKISARNIDNYVVKFRRIFEEDPQNPKIFITHPRRGYSFGLMQS